MYLEVFLGSAGSTASLQDVGDLRSLKVVVHPGDGGTLDAALDGIGRLAETGDAFLEVAALKRLAGAAAQDPKWLAEFDAMVSYAASRGWVDDEGQALQAHCEWES